jgi:hypothetical protein
MHGLFLPFTRTGKATEQLAVEVKEHLGLGPYEAVDPYEVLPQVPAHVLTHSEVLKALPAELRRVLFGKYNNDWSAVGLGPDPASGEEIVLLNHTDHRNRLRVSLMEEIVHVIRRHPRTRLILDGHGDWKRPYDRIAEDEAFNVGAACIIPYRWLFQLVDGGHMDVAEISEHCGVSRSYVTYRIKRAGLYHVYQKRLGRAGVPR